MLHSQIAGSAVTESALRSGLFEGGPLMETSHASSLHLKHAGLERQIAEELNRPMPDTATIQQLKKRKLRIKEELSQH